MIDIDLKCIQGNFELNAKCSIDTPVLGLFGPSGAGKSTLLAMIAGLKKPTAGHLIVDGEYLFDSAKGIDLAPHKRRIGTVFQDSLLFPHLNVRDNLNYGFNLLAKKQQRLKFSQIVELLEVGHLFTQKPHQLSGGEKQRVALGRALLTSPRLLLLDEPLASLDVRLKRQILPFLRRAKDELKIPMIYVSHAIDEILYLTSQIAMIDAGKIIATGKFHELIHEQKVLVLAQSLGLENVLHTQVLEQHPNHGYSLTSIGTQLLVIPLIEAVIGSQVSVTIAANNIALSTKRVEGISIQNQLVGKVDDIQQVGTRMLVSVDVGVQLLVEVTAKSLLDMQIGQGSTVFCLFKTQSIQLFPAINLQ